MAIWKPFKKIPKYEVSDEGQVRNGRTGLILKSCFDKSGYEQICLSDGGRRRTYKVGRMVAETHCDGYSDDKIASYKDGDKTRNYANNLEWVDHSTAVGRTYERGRTQDHKMKPIRCIETGEEFASIKECSIKMGINRHIITRSVTGASYRNTCGYTFEYI